MRWNGDSDVSPHRPYRFPPPGQLDNVGRGGIPEAGDTPVAIALAGAPDRGTITPSVKGAGDKVLPGFSAGSEERR